MSDFVSMRVIAEAAGVSKAAVSRVINGRPAGIRISVTTRERILAAVRQFGYQPTRFAQDQAPRRPATIALVFASGGLDASASHLPAIDAVVTANGYRLLLAILPADSVAARERVSGLLQDGVAGFLCVPAVMPVVVDRVAGTCPVVVVDAVGGETILRSLGVDIPVPVIPPPVIQPVPVVAPPVTQPVPAISPPIIKPAPAVVAAVPAPTLPVIPLPPSPTPVAAPNPIPETPSDTPVGVPASAGVPAEPIPAPEPASPVAEPIPPDPEPEPAQEPVPVPPASIESPPAADPPVIPIPVPAPEPPPVEPVTAPAPVSEPQPEVVEPPPVLPAESTPPAPVSAPPPEPAVITPAPLSPPPVMDLPIDIPKSSELGEEAVSGDEAAEVPSDQTTDAAPATVINPIPDKE